MEYEHDHRIVLPNGTIKNIHAVGHPVLDENGQVVEYVGTAVDVTERKLAEDELHKHREHLEDLVKQRTAELAVLNQLVYGSRPGPRGRSRDRPVDLQPRCGHGRRRRGKVPRDVQPLSRSGMNA